MRQVSQMALIAAIVATMLYLPFCVALGLLLGLAGVPLDDILSLGGVLNPYTGPLAGWLMFFVAAMVYTGFTFSWDPMQGFTEE
jgi:hypothetical protein